MHPLSLLPFFACRQNLLLGLVQAVARNGPSQHTQGHRLRLWIRGVRLVGFPAQAISRRGCRFFGVRVLFAPLILLRFPCLLLLRLQGSTVLVAAQPSVPVQECSELLVMLTGTPWWGLRAPVRVQGDVRDCQRCQDFWFFVLNFMRLRGLMWPLAPRDPETHQGSFQNPALTALVFWL